jgi:hypothetical protein
LAGDEADAAGRRVVQDGLATLERTDLAEQVLRRYAPDARDGLRLALHPLPTAGAKVLERQS